MFTKVLFVQKVKLEIIISTTQYTGKKASAAVVQENTIQHCRGNKLVLHIVMNEFKPHNVETNKRVTEECI